MFLKVSLNGNISLIKIKNLELEELVTSITKNLNIHDINFFTQEKILISNDDVIEYINQYISNDSNFILYLNGKFLLHILTI